MIVQGITILPADEKSVAPDYKLSAAARSVLERAHGHAQRFVVLRSWREKVEVFVGARELESMGLARVVLVSDLDGETSKVYRLTERGEAVARVVCAA